MDSTINVAMIGFSGHPHLILQGLDAYPTGRLTALAISDQERQWLPDELARSVKLFPFERYEQMLDQIKPDVVGACEPVGCHHQVIAACLQRGIHVMAEKPLCCSFEQLQHLQALHQRSGVKLNILLNARFDAIYQRARDIIDSGRIGRVGTVFGQKSYKMGDRPSWYHQRETFCGTIPFVGCHAIDLIRYLTGREFASVAAWHKNLFHPQYPAMEDTAAIAFTLDNEACGSMTLDYLRPQAATTHGDDRIRIAGSKGVLEVRAAERSLIVIDDSGQEHTKVEPGHDSIFADFLAGIYQNKPTLLDDVTPFEVTRVCLASQQSAQTGKIIHLR